MRRHIALFPLVFSLGCGVIGESVDTTEQDNHVDPTDDENLGFVQVDTPNAVTTDAVGTGAAYYPGNGSSTSMAFGQPLRVRAGEGSVAIGGLVSGSQKVTIAK